MPPRQVLGTTGCLWTCGLAGLVRYDGHAMDTVVGAGQVPPCKPRRFRTLGDLRLLAAAFRAAGEAQVVTRLPLPEVVALLLSRTGLPRDVDPDGAWVAAGRGARLVARWRGGVDSCLIRGLVAGTLLADHPDVMLHVGFRPEPGGSARADGHAWLSVGERTLGLAQTPTHEPYSAALAVPMHRPKGAA